MVDHRFSHITNPKTFPAEATLAKSHLPEVPEAPGPSRFVKGPDLVEC